MATTPNLNLPIFTIADMAKLDTLLNGVTSALDTNIQAKLDQIGMRRGTATQRNNATASANDYWSDTTDGLLYKYSGSAWLVAPGQLLGVMTGSTSNTTGVPGTLVGTIVSTPVLPAGQRVKVMASYSQFTSTSGAPSFTRIQARNNAADVNWTTFDVLSGARGWSNAASGVHDSVTPAVIFTTTTAAKVSAGIYIASGTTGVAGADGTQLWIESA